MKINMYVIFDKAAKMYNKPFYLLNEQIALRSAVDLLSTPGTDIYNNPEDFAMFKLGEYDDENATITNDPDMPLVCRFHELAPNIRIVSNPLATDELETEPESKQA